MINPKARPCEVLLPQVVAGGPSCTRRQQPWVLTAAVLASTMAFVDESVVNIALPAMEKDLAASLATMQWVVNAYTLGLAALLLTGGAAGDQFGRRKIFTLGLAIFAVTSLGCGLAPDSLMLIACRGAQGLGAAFLIPSSLVLSRTKKDSTANSPTLVSITAKLASPPRTDSANLHGAKESLTIEFMVLTYCTG